MYCSKIKSIKKMGEVKTYDLNTPIYENFMLNNGVLSHNSGKSWAILSVCEMISKENGKPFTVDNVVFSLKELMTLINSNKLEKGSCIMFDEPQCSISAREWQSEANRIFNYLLSTFRHKCFNLFFCTPYEDLLDLSTRKLFQAKFETMGINKNTQMCRVKPKTVQYNSQYKKFYEPFLRMAVKNPNSSSYSTIAVRNWNIPKPSKELIDAYEIKKSDFTSKLNTDIERRLDAYETKKEKQLQKNLPAGTMVEDKSDIIKIPLTPVQKDILKYLKKGWKKKDIAIKIGKDPSTISANLNWMRDKGYNIA